MIKAKVIPQTVQVFFLNPSDGTGEEIDLHAGDLNQIVDAFDRFQKTQAMVIEKLRLSRAGVGGEYHEV